MNTPNFDNVVLSENTWAGMKEIIQPAEKPLSIFGGVNVVVSKFVPNNIMLLRQGEKVVAIVQVGDEAQQIVHLTASGVGMRAKFANFVDRIRKLLARIGGR